MIIFELTKNLDIMNKTVTIPLEEFDKLRNGFEESRLKKQLEAEVTELREKLEIKESDLKKILLSDFVETNLKFSYRHFLSNTYYFRKDKTPLWIKRFFNKD